MAVLVIAGTMMSCSSSSALLGDNELINQLTKQLGISQLQAMGGAGALFSLAQEKLATEDFAKIASVVPGMDQMIEQAKEAGGLGDTIGSLAGLSDTFTKLGLSGDQAAQLVPAVTDYVGAKGGADVGNMLADVLK